MTQKLTLESVAFYLNFKYFHTCDLDACVCSSCGKFTTSVVVCVRTLDTEKQFVTSVLTIQGHNSSVVRMIVTANCGILRQVCPTSALVTLSKVPQHIFDLYSIINQLF
jgi:predicted molibdopterin-dependent oxidoreductase YjgC